MGLTLTDPETTEEIIFSDWRQWPQMTGPGGKPWQATETTRQLAVAHRRAAAYELLVLAHLSPAGSSWAARYALLARAASRCTHGPLWLRSVTADVSLADLLYPVMAPHEQAAYTALSEAIDEQRRTTAKAAG